jgi:putative phosphoesterase
VNERLRTHDPPSHDPDPPPHDPDLPPHDPGPLRVVVVADTHLRRSWPNRRLPDAARQVLATADVILHAGDITQAEHLDDLARHAPLHAVLGNNDPELIGVLPETLQLELAGVRIAMIHDSGPARGRERRLHERFPDAEVIVFGHSHIPWNAPGEGGQLLFNPGSPTERRGRPHRTIGVLELASGRVVDARIEVVDD